MLRESKQGVYIYQSVSTTQYNILATWQFKGQIVIVDRGGHCEYFVTLCDLQNASEVLLNLGIGSSPAHNAINYGVSGVELRSFGVS